MRTVFFVRYITNLGTLNKKIQKLLNLSENSVVVCHKNKKLQSMQLNTYGQLENCQERIYNALWSGSRWDKENALNYARLNIPGLNNDLVIKWGIWSQQEFGRGHRPVPYTSFLDDFSLDLNLRFSSEVISERMRTDFSSPISPNAVQIVFFSPEPLQRSTVLYEEKGHDGQEHQLKVSDFISVLDYAMKFAEMNSDADFDKYNKAKLAIKTVDLALNHKPVDKPLNKTLHIVNDILTEYAKSISKDKEAKRDATGISLLVDLAIDFLVRG